MTVALAALSIALLIGAPTLVHALRDLRQRQRVRARLAAQIAGLDLRPSFAFAAARDTACPLPAPERTHVPPRPIVIAYETDEVPLELMYERAS